MKIGDQFGTRVVVALGWMRQRKPKQRARSATMRCEQGHDQEMARSTAVLGKGCRRCGPTHPRTRHAPIGTRIGTREVVSEGRRAFATQSARSVVVRCDCGHEKGLTVYQFLAGHECRACAIPGATTHGASNTPEHRRWLGIRQRGAMDWGFEDFVAEVGDPVDGCRLLAADTSKPIGPGNWAWVPMHSFEGETMEQAAARLGMSRQGIHHRISSGWSKQDAYTTPKGHTLGPKQQRADGRLNGMNRASLPCRVFVAATEGHGHTAAALAAHLSEDPEKVGMAILGLVKRGHLTANVVPA